MTPEEWQRNEAIRWLVLAAKDLHAALLMAVEEPSASVFHSQHIVRIRLTPLADNGLAA
jgi:hypothetical protein